MHVSTNGLSAIMLMGLLLGMPVNADIHNKRDDCPCPAPPPPPPDSRYDRYAHGPIRNERSPSCPPNTPQRDVHFKRDLELVPPCPPNSPVERIHVKRDHCPCPPPPPPPPPKAKRGILPKPCRKGFNELGGHTSHEDLD